MNDCLDAAMAELEAVGITPRVEHGGKHLHLVWDTDTGQRKYVTAVSPSDRRAPLNVRSDIRRMLREDGVIGSDAPAVVPRLFLKGGAAFCSSLDVASHFEKAHKNVLASIDAAVADSGEFGRLNFQPSSYLTEQSKQLRCFNMTRDGFTLLAMGFTGSAAMAWKVKYLEAFNAMERELQGMAPTHLEARVRKLEGDLEALIDLSLTAPTPEPGFIIVKAYKRRARRAAA